MNCDIILDDSVKSGSVVTTILPSGEYSTFKFPSGTLLRQDIPQSQDCIRLLQNRNYNSTSAGFIAAVLPKPGKTYGPGFLPARLVLMQGVHNASGSLKLIVHPWNFRCSEKSLPTLIREMSLEDLVESLFDPVPQEIDACVGEVLYFNQVSGPKHSSWLSSVVVLEHYNGSKYFESAPMQDNWGGKVFMNPCAMQRYEFIRFPEKTLRMKSNMKLCKNRCRISSYLCLPKCVAARNQNLTLLMCLRVHFDEMLNFFFQPLPSPRDCDYQEFVPITRKQACKLDAITKTGVSIEKYNTILHLLATENGKGILKFRRMDVSGKRSKFIVSIVAQPTSGYKSFATKEDQAYIWSENVSKPFVRDFDVPEGIVFGFFYPSMYEQVLEENHDIHSFFDDNRDLHPQVTGLNPPFSIQ